MRTYAAATVAALNDDSVQPRVLVTITTREGTFRFAQERLKFGTDWYEPRLAGPIQIQSDIRAGGNSTPSGRTVSLELVNADGFFSEWTPDVYRQGNIQIDEVLQDAAATLRTTNFIATAASFDRQRFRLEPNPRTSLCGGPGR